MKMQRRIGGGANTYSLSAKQAKRVGLFTFILLFLCTAVLGCAFLLPKKQTPLTAHAATVDVQPGMTMVSQNRHNVRGGTDNNGNYYINPTNVTYGGFNGGDDGSGLNIPNNLQLNVGTNPGSQLITIRNIRSTLDFDIAFVEFTMNVTVPAGGKVTVKYKFDATASKSADSIDGASHFAAELFHFGTGANGDGANPVTVSSLALEPSGGGGANSVMRLDGGGPTHIHSCSGNISNIGVNSSHTPVTSFGTPTSYSPAQGTYTTTAITYTNNSNASKTYKEYFGFMGSASPATDCCHIFMTTLNITPVQVEYEKISKPAVSGADSQNYDGSQKTFNISGIDATKTKLVKVTKKGLDGQDTTLYEFDPFTGTSGTVISGTNPLTGGQCKFTDAGIYTFSFRPLGAIWADSLPNPSTAPYDLKLYIFPKKVNKPTVAAADANGKDYTGAAQTFTLAMSGGLTSANWSQSISIDTNKGGSCPTDVTDKANGSFEVTDVGDYDVYLTLADETNTCWGDKTYSKTSWSGSNAGGTAQVTLKVKPFELTFDSFTCDKLDQNNNWTWNMGDTATIKVKLSGFKLATDTTDTDPDKVSLIYYYKGTNVSENPVSADSETYDPATKTIEATIKLPATLAQAKYTFGVKPDENTGAGKNYTVNTNHSEKKFEVTAQTFDPSVLVWTYTVDGVLDATKTLANGGKLKYALKSDGNAKVYNPQIQILTNTYDYTSKIDIDYTAGTNGYTGDLSKSAVSSGYATMVTLKVIDSDTKFANSTNNANITVAADGKSATVKLNWEIEKGDLDLSGIKWEYWYKTKDGTLKTGEYTQALEYNDGRYIYIRIKKDSLPGGLTFDSNYEDIQPTWETFGDRQKDVNTHTTTVDPLTDLVVDPSFNAPSPTDAAFTLNWEITPKKLIAKFKKGKDCKHNFSNANGSGFYYLPELDLDKMGLPANFATYFELKYFDSANAEVTLSQIDNDANPTNEKSYTVKAYINTSVAAANNYVIVDAAGNTEPSTTFKTGSNNDPVSFTVGGKDDSDPDDPIKAVYDGKEHFGESLIEVKADDGTVLTLGNDYTIVYYTGAIPQAGNELPSGTFPSGAGTYCIEIVLTPSAESVYFIDGDGYYTVEVEKQEVAVTVDGSDGLQPVTVDYDKKAHFDKVVLKGADGKEFDPALYTVKYYDAEGNELGLGELPLNAGAYKAVIALDNSIADNYSLSNDTFEIVINKLKLETPVIEGLTFTGGVFTLDGLLSDGKITGFDKDLMTLKFAGAAQVRNAGDYTAVITLTDDAAKNYEFVTDVTPSKHSLAKYSLAVDSVTERTITFTVAKAVLKADWDKSGETPVLKSLDAFKDLADVEAVIYAYADANSDTPVNELSKGGTYYFEAALTGADAENFIFEDTGSNVSARLEHKLSQNAAAAFFNNALSFVKSNWLWFAIGGGIFLFLLLLIIILAATRKRRKEKAEERKLEKEKKAEEKARKEEERRLKEEQREEEKRSREQEREDAKAKAEAERELQKAKAEAELAKMRAEMGMAGAGAMAMQAMAQPQQQMPVQQQAMPQQMQQPQYPQMQQPYYPQQPMQSGSDNSVMMQLMQQQLTEMRTQQNASLRAELEMMKMMQNQQHQPIYPQQPYYSQQQPQAGNNGGEISMSALGELVVSALKTMAKGGIQTAERAELPQKTEESAATTVNTPTVYSPDAVITTTTTVDTTKTSANTKQPQRISRDKDNTIFDIDGFYDTFEENK